MKNWKIEKLKKWKNRVIPIPTFLKWENSKKVGLMVKKVEKWESIENEKVGIGKNIKDNDFILSLQVLGRRHKNDQKNGKKVL